MEITSRPATHNKKVVMVTITESDGVHVDTWRVEAKYNHIVSTTWNKKTCDGLLVNAKLCVSLPSHIEDALREYLRKK